MPNEALKFTDDDGNEKIDSLFLNQPIKYFTRLLESTNYSVYSFTGDWGSGKTTFIKLWEKSMSPAEYIHIDAFEMDYETEPFIMFIKHFNKYLKDQKNIDQELLNSFMAKAKNIFLRSMKTIGKTGMNALVGKIVGNENAKNIISDFSEILFDQLVIDESNESSLFDSLKDILSKITESLEKPIYVIIHELDRCRPSFALETLEKIKHIFTVKNIKFILVYNNYILASIIEKTYGISNGNRYLDKFIQKSIAINNDYNFSNWFSDELKNLKEPDPSSMQHILNSLEGSSKIFSTIKKTYNLTLRDFKMLISNLLNIRTNALPDSPVGDKFLFIIIAFEVLRIIDTKKYIVLKSIIETNSVLDLNSPEAAEIINLMNSINCKATPEEAIDIFKEYINGEYTKPWYI